MTKKFIVVLFYKFIKINNPEQLKKEQFKLAQDCHLTGRMIISDEGINATFEGRQEDIKKYQIAFKQDPRFIDIVFKESTGTGSAFTQLSVKVRPEIVTLGVSQSVLATDTAPAVSVDELEKWYQDNHDFVILDLRNDYEIKVGYFERTVHLDLNNFRDLPAKLPILSGLRDKKIVAVCTGGIRCEKATRLLKRYGFKNLYQLKDGIHTYIQRYPGRRFKGTLYVFDNRMTTPVIDWPDREIIGRCEFCDKKTEHYASDDSVRPSQKVLCCQLCFKKHQNRLRAVVSEAGARPFLKNLSLEIY